ncbi:PTS sugar transporter subunit IIB [Psychrilyobacter atlanticus]|uniref:PTS sugar transporter subunit IIB n=1 Tax=Psychrilyobacter atlanticus TaxID=271091 RepID=UPI00042268CA|nr:PTS sugar transporter subunit IIB [Psychrilyobacter atlanticus]
MKKILLLCNAGMSTSIVVKKMKEAAEKKEIETEINAVSMDKFEENLDKYDIFLLGPQISFKKNELQAKADAVNKKVEVINSMDYGMMKGEKILEETLVKLEK